MSTRSERLFTLHAWCRTHHGVIVTAPSCTSSGSSNAAITRLRLGPAC